MNNSKVVATIEARMTSSRFPSKMMANICGRPALARLFERAQACTSLDEIILATTINANDDVLVELADSHGISSFRGSEEDVLDRVVGAQRSANADVVVELIGDGILLDPEMVDIAVETFLANTHDVVSNTWQRTWPLGVSVQVFTLEALAWVNEHIDDAAVHEHVSLYFYENQDKYNVHHLVAPARSKGRSGWRFHLDYPEDLEFLNRVYADLEPIHGPLFLTETIVHHLNEFPEIAEINRGCEERSAR